MLYKRRYCTLVVKLGRKGYSKTRMALEIGVHRTTLDLWVRKYDEFREAMALARDAELVHWERLGHEAIIASEKPVPKQGPEFNKRTRRKHRRLARQRFNEQLWIKTMERRFPRDYGPGRA